MKIKHCELKEANEFIERHHRHHKRVVGHRFSLKVVGADGETLGVAIIGRPVARQVDQVNVLEVTRLCTDGSKNACSALYSAAARAGRELGYTKIQTYILENEPGVTLVASGWNLEDPACGGGQWKRPDGSPRRQDQPTCLKQRWSKVLN